MSDEAAPAPGLDAGDVSDPPAESDERTIQQRFEVYHLENPQVYAELCLLARRAAKKGQGRIGIGMLWEVLRWERFMNASDPSSTFALNNVYRSRYARLIMTREPDLKDIFETRKLTS